MGWMCLVVTIDLCCMSNHLLAFDALYKGLKTLVSSGPCFFDIHCWYDPDGITPFIKFQVNPIILTPPSLKLNSVKMPHFILFQVNGLCHSDQCKTHGIFDICLVREGIRMVGLDWSCEDQQDISIWEFTSEGWYGHLGLTIHKTIHPECTNSMADDTLESWRLKICKNPSVTIMIHVCKSKAWLAQIGQYLLRLLCIKNPAGTNVSGFWCGIHRWFEILFYCTLISYFYLCNEEPLTSIVHLSQSGEWHSGWVHPNGVGQFWFNCLSCCIHFKLDANISLHQLLMYSLSYFSLWNLIKCTLFYLSGSMILVVSQGKRIKD